MKNMQSTALAIVRCCSLFKKSRGMRLLGGISCAVLCSSLIGCRLPRVAETVEINGKSYRTGFYGDCYLMDDLPLSGLEYELDEITYQALQHPEFDLWYNGSDSVMYCAEDQWEAAKTYYADDQQYSYYCSVGVAIQDQNNPTEDKIKPTVYDISEKVDVQKFKELLEFGEGNEYIPFAYGKNSEQEQKTVTMPLPDDKQRLIFYRESKDGCFCSYRGSHFYVVNGQLFLTYQYHPNKWIATPVPEALSNYFCELAKDFDEINKETATNEGKSTKS